MIYRSEVLDKPAQYYGRVIRYLICQIEFILYNQKHQIHTFCASVCVLTQGGLERIATTLAGKDLKQSCSVDILISNDALCLKMPCTHYTLLILLLGARDSVCASSVGYFRRSCTLFIINSLLPGSDRSSIESCLPDCFGLLKPVDIDSCLLLGPLPWR